VCVCVCVCVRVLRACEERRGRCSIHRSGGAGPSRWFDDGATGGGRPELLLRVPLAGVYAPFRTILAALARYRSPINDHHVD